MKTIEERAACLADYVLEDVDPIDALLFRKLITESYMAGEVAGFLAGDRGVNGEEKGVPKVIAEDAVLFADALIAELEKR